MADSLLQALYNRMTSPLVPQLADAGEQAETAMSEPSLDASPTMAMAKGFGAGAMKGLGRVLSDATSPVSLLAMLASGGLSAGAKGAGAGVTAARAAAPELGALSAEFAPVGGEAAYNAGRAVSALADPTEAAYGRILARMGPETGKISPEMAILTGGTVGGLGYAGSKLISALKAGASNANHRLNSIQKAADILGEQGK